MNTASRSSKIVSVEGSSRHDTWRQAERTDRSCPSCGANAETVPESGMVRCGAPGCGWVYRARSPKEGEGDYWSGYIDDHREQRYDRLRGTFYDLLWKRVRGLARNPGGVTPAILDVGCVPGHFLRRAKRDGWQIHGCELTQELCQRTRDFCGARTWCGPMEDVEFGSQRFDMITLMDVFRAVSNPKALVTKARSLLNPGGVLVIREIDAQRSLGLRRVHTGYPFDMQIVTADQLVGMFDAAGFDRSWWINSPVSLLTRPRVCRYAERHPRVYRAGLHALDHALRVADACAREAVRTPQFLAVGRVSGADNAQAGDAITRREAA